MGVARLAESDVRVALATLKDSTPSEWTTAGGVLQELTAAVAAADGDEPSSADV